MHQIRFFKTIFNVDDIVTHLTFKIENNIKTDFKNYGKWKYSGTCNKLFHCVHPAMDGVQMS